MAGDDREPTGPTPGIGPMGRGASQAASSRPTNGLRTRRPNAAGSGGASAVDAGASLRRGCRPAADASLWRAAPAAPLAGGERDRRTPRARRQLLRGDEAPDQLALCVLAKRIQLDAATREADGVLQRAGRLRVRRQALEHVAEAVAVGLARRVDPLPVESRQQLTVATARRPPAAVRPGRAARTPWRPRRRRHRRGQPCRASPRGRPRPRPSACRTATSSVRRLLRALESSTSGQKRPATSERGCVPGWRASQPSSETPAGVRASAKRRLPTRARRRRTGARGAWQQG